LEVDPRVCGGNSQYSDDHETIFGRSPRMRGKRWWRATCGRTPGSIPAYAGETEHRRRGAHSDGVDPRVCGGNSVTTICGDRARGRSPRMRGKPGAARRRSSLRGSIPAYAGETRIIWRYAAADRV